MPAKVRSWGYMGIVSDNAIVIDRASSIQNYESPYARIGSYDCSRHHHRALPYKCAFRNYGLVADNRRVEHRVFAYHFLSGGIVTNGYYCSVHCISMFIEYFLNCPRMPTVPDDPHGIPLITLTLLSAGTQPMPEARVMANRSPSVGFSGSAL